jgi:hypothetical protein
VSFGPITIVIPETPPSLNDVVGQGHWRRYHTVKKRWQAMLLEQLTAAEPPRMRRVLVEGVVTFPDRRKHDQGNYRFVLEKALGDALQAGGYLHDDDWNSYEFGNLSADYEKGVRRTRLTLFPIDLTVAA